MMIVTIVLQVWLIRDSVEELGSNDTEYPEPLDVMLTLL